MNVGGLHIQHVQLRKIKNKKRTYDPTSAELSKPRISNVPSVTSNVPEVTEQGDRIT
jgi:hypothetical protein